jgi:ubiquinone/menaquinone biosynthesis C-methylase UbiE
MADSSKGYFDAIGSRWDEMQQGFFSTAVREKAFSAAQVVNGKVAADIGAGTGFVTEGLLDRGLKVIAVDQSQAMLEALRAKFSSVQQVDCRVGDAEKLPVASASVDFVFANMYLHHVESPPTAIREMVRILRHGGKLVITDLDTHDFDFLRTEHHDRWLGFERDHVRQWLGEAGLIDVEVDCVGDNCCTTSAQGSDVAISIFVASGTRPLGCIAD